MLLCSYIVSKQACRKTVQRKNTSKWSNKAKAAHCYCRWQQIVVDDDNGSRLKSRTWNFLHRSYLQLWFQRPCWQERRYLKLPIVNALRGGHSIIIISTFLCVTLPILPVYTWKYTRAWQHTSFIQKCKNIWTMNVYLIGQIRKKY